MVYGRYIHCQRFMYSPFTPHIRASHVVLTQEVLDNWGWSCHFEMKSRAYWKSLKEGHVWIMVGISNRDPYCNDFWKHRNSEDVDQSWQLFGSQTLLHFPLHNWGLKKNRPEETTKMFPLGCFKTTFFPERKNPYDFWNPRRAFKPTAPLCQGTSDTLACARKALFFCWGFMDALNHQLNLFNILTFWLSMINLLKETDYTLMIISLFVLLRFHIAIHSRW